MVRLIKLRSNHARLLQSLADFLISKKWKEPIEIGGTLFPRSSVCGNLNSSANLTMDPKSLSADFRDFLKSLNDHDVEYLLVGGHAVAYHGYVRPQDMDVWIAVNPDNARRMVAAVEAFFGCKLQGLAPDWFLDTDQVTRFGVRPNLIEILTKIDGSDFAESYSHRVISELDGVHINIIALADLKANKKATGRNKDLADLDNLP